MPGRQGEARAIPEAGAQVLETAGPGTKTALCGSRFPEPDGSWEGQRAYRECTALSVPAGPKPVTCRRDRVHFLSDHLADRSLGLFQVVIHLETEPETF